MRRASSAVLRAVLAAALGAVILLPPRVARSERRDCLAHHVHAQELRARGELRAARAELRACTDPNCPAEVARDCTAWLSELSAAIPSLVIDVRDADGRDVTDASVSVDDRPITAYPSGQAIELDPGPHRVRVARANGAHAEEDVVMHTGDHARRVTLTFPRPIVVEAPPPSRTSEKDLGHERNVSPLVIVLGSVAAASAVSAASFGIAGYSRHQALQRDCGPSCESGRVDGVRNLYVVSDVSLGLSIVTAGLAVFFLVNQR